jgi:hypothetical protein
MRELCLDQLEVLGKVDPVFPEWKGDILKHEEVLNQPADYVFTKLLMDYRKSKFTEKHSEILSKKRK